MPAPFATVADVEAAHRPLSDTEQATARNALVLASGLVRSLAARVDERIADGSLDPDLVQSVVVAAVLRVLHNPEGARSRTETAGPFSTTTTYADEVANLSLLRAEVRLLRPASSGVAGLGTIRVRSGYPRP